MTGWRLGFAAGRAGAHRRAHPGEVIRRYRAVPGGAEGRRRGARSRREPGRADPGRAAAAAGRRALRRSGGRLHGRVPQGGDVSLGPAAGTASPRRSFARRALEEMRCVVLARKRIRPRGRGLLPHCPDRRADRLRLAAERLGRALAGRAQRRTCHDRLIPPSEAPAPAALDCDHGQRRAARPAAVFGWITGRLPDVPRLPRQLIVIAPPADGPEQISHALSAAGGRRRAARDQRVAQAPGRTPGGGGATRPSCPRSPRPSPCCRDRTRPNCRRRQRPHPR